MILRYAAVVLIFLCSACQGGEKSLPHLQGQNKLEEKVEVVKIEEIIKQPEAFLSKEVIVEGVAIPGLAFEFEDEQPYLLKGRSGEIWVITTQVVPAKRSRVRVKGTVEAPYQIKGRHYRVVILEEERWELR